VALTIVSSFVARPASTCVREESVETVPRVVIMLSSLAMRAFSIRVTEELVKAVVYILSTAVLMVSSLAFRVFSTWMRAELVGMHARASSTPSSLVLGSPFAEKNVGQGVIQAFEHA
jgi:hypothetical protein